MAGKWANAALTQQTWPNDLRLNGTTVPTELYGRLRDGGLARSITQASTLQFKFANGDRWVSSHEAANPFLAPTPRWIYGIPNGFVLVQYAKSGDDVTLTAEDWVINHLRGFTGTKAQAAGTRTFVDFARQLCAEAGVPIIADNAAAPLQQPVQRGGTNAPDEDTWTCLKRIADDRGWYCFSDGTSIILGPASWLLSWGGAPAMTICEASHPAVGATMVEVIDGSMDTGKPVSQLSVTTRASVWCADPGAWVRIAAGLGPISGDWIVSDINRQNLASDQLAVSLAVPTPPKAEPAADSTTTTSSTSASSGSASSSAGLSTTKNIQVVYGRISNDAWNRLLAMGYRGRAGDNTEALYVSAADLNTVGYRRAEDGSFVSSSYYSSGTSTSSGASGQQTEAETVRVVYGTVSPTVWNNLLQQGYTPQGGGGGTVLMVKPSDWRLANL